MENSKKNKVKSISKSSEKPQKKLTVDQIMEALMAIEGTVEQPWSGGTRVRMNVIPRRQKIDTKGEH